MIQELVPDAQNRRRPRADGGDGAGKRDAEVHASRIRHLRLHDNHRKRPGHSAREHHLIENAERYGLSELYQLRGRVGRSNRRAYAYLLVPPDTELTEIARKRLAALKEFSDLGAGFKIAALDLELRGAGNLLGGEQHGHINSVGFDTYVRLMEETVRELKGEEVPVEIHSSLNLGLDIRIPPEYIADENQRLRAYRQIANAADDAAREKVAKELEDRYGPVPEAVKNLLEYSELKTLAEKLGIEAGRPPPRDPECKVP